MITDPLEPLIETIADRLVEPIVDRVCERLMGELGSLIQQPGPAPQRDGYVSAKEAAELLGVHRRTLGRMLSRGDLEAIRLTEPNGELRIARSEIQRYLNENRAVI